MDVFILSSNDGPISFIHGVFGSDADAKKHMDTLIAAQTPQQLGDVDMWMKLSTQTTGMDKQHCLTLANKQKEAIISGPQVIDHSECSVEGVAAYAFAGEVYTISCWEVGVGRPAL